MKKARRGGPFRQTQARRRETRAGPAVILYFVRISTVWEAASQSMPTSSAAHRSRSLK